MQLAILSIILWPQVQAHPPRRLQFSPDRINLVTGRSRTGKSAITYIVDYVLGSEKCAIPVGEIRDAVSWYGLVLDLGYTQMIVAREAPGERIESSNYYIDERSQVEVPDRVEKNTNRDSFKQRMNRFAGLPNIDFDVERTRNGFLSRPGFRDMAAFNFLPQHVVANPYTLLFKADTTEHRQKLRTIFPFVLGAVSAQHLLAEHEREDLRKRIQRLEVERDRRRRAAETWKAEASGLYLRALELGLLPATNAEPQSLSECLRSLRQIPSLLEQRRPPQVQPGNTAAAVEQLEELRRLERDADRAIGQLRQRLQRITSLRDSMSEFDSTSRTYGDRVQGAGWFRERLAGKADCPVCGSSQDSAKITLSQIEIAARELADQQRAVRRVPPTLERELAEIKSQLRAKEEELRGLRTKRSELERKRAEAGAGQRLEDVYRFGGRVEQALKNLNESEEGSDLSEQIEDLRSQLSELSELLDENARGRRLETALDFVSRDIAHFAQFMRLERADDIVKLDIKELSLVFGSMEKGRKDVLWEIGSGENWMGYHVSALLALHHLFLKLERSYVPTFLIIDQPSQVYFPAGISELAEQTEGLAESHEILATRRIFQTLEEGLRRMDYRLQIIVTEHADAETLGGMATVNVVADWHGHDSDYLIPRAWLASNEVESR